MSKFKSILAKIGKPLKGVLKYPAVRTIFPLGNMIAEASKIITPNKSDKIWSNPIFKDIYQLLILVGIIYFLLTGDIESAEFLKDME